MAQSELTAGALTASRGKLPRWPWVVALYLKLPPLWRLFGAQFLVVARRT
jgi:hypothetical protein